MTIDQGRSNEARRAFAVEAERLVRMVTDPTDPLWPGTVDAVRQALIDAQQMARKLDQAELNVKDVTLVAEFARAYSKSELSDVGEAITRLLIWVASRQLVDDEL